MMRKASEMKDKMLKDGFSPMEMCRQMTSAVAKAAEMGSYANPELRTLFEDWIQEIEKEILVFVADKGKTDPGEIAVNLRINEDSAVFLISRLAQKKKIKITGIETGEQDARDNKISSENPGEEEKECKT